MTSGNKTHTAVYFLRASTILQSPKTSGTQNVPKFPQISQEQWLTSLIFLNNHHERKQKGKKIYRSELRSCKKIKIAYCSLNCIFLPGR